MIRAILKAQLLSIRNSRISFGWTNSLASLAASAVWYGFWTVLAIGAYQFTYDPAFREIVELTLPRGLLFVVLYWQVAPILVASLGAALDLRKLLVYPIPANRLFWVEVVLRLTTGIEMIILMTGSMLGLVLSPLNGGWPAVWRVVPAALVFIIFNLLLSAGLRSLIERMLSNKRLRELFVLLLVMLAALPQMLTVFGLPEGQLREWVSQPPAPIFPWIVVGQMALSGPTAVGWTVLLSWTVAVGVFARWQFGRSLRFDASETQPIVKLSNHGWIDSLYQFPSLFLPDPYAALVEKELRTLARAPRFRLAFIMGFTFGLVIWLPMTLRDASHNPLTANFLTIVCVYSLTLLGQVSYWNSLGFDRTAVQAYFCFPVKLSRVLVSKNIAAILFILLEMALVIASCLALRMPTPPHKIIEAFLVTLTMGVYLLAAGNLCSIHLPKAMNPERGARGGSSGRSQMLILIVYPLTALPVLLAYGGRYAFGHAAIFYGILLSAFVIGAIFYWIAMESAVRAGENKREAIISELSRAAGPVAAE